MFNKTSPEPNLPNDIPIALTCLNAGKRVIMRYPVRRKSMASYAYFKKQYVPMEEAKLGIMTHALHYGGGVFEGIRGNWNERKKQTYLFRLKEHYQRLQEGCRVLKINLPYTVDELCQMTVKLVEMNGLQEDLSFSLQERRKVGRPSA
jgi:branched-subunit amino acid aminotransferase/4-amino-4-deoxychorismate lyase